MGADYISLGATVQPTATVDRDAAEAIVREHFAEIKARIDVIDPSGRFEDLEADENEIIETIASGVAWFHGGRDFDTFAIPGSDHLRFVTSGGMSWGDSPFEEYDAVVIAVDAASELPDFARKVGILGGGIRLDYADAADGESAADDATAR